MSLQQTRTSPSAAVVDSPDRTGCIIWRNASRRVLRSVGILAAAWTLAACASVAYQGPASVGSPSAALRAVPPTLTFNQRVASNTLAQSPMYAPNIAIGDSTLGATIVRMRRLSPAFDSAMAALEASHIPVVIGTARQLADQLPPGYRHAGGWQAVTVFYPLTRDHAPGRPIEHIAVVVRLAGLQAALRGKQATALDSSMYERYIERVLGHEIYGHLMPQLQYGRTAPIVCDDPTSQADWYTACVMERERHVVNQLAEARGLFADASVAQPPQKQPPSR